MRPISSNAAGLRQRLVEVAALGRLHARRAAALARALADEPVGVADERLERVVAAAGDPDPAGVPVVDEDRRAAGLRVGVGREAADVPAVAHRQQRQHGDLRVLGGVQRAEQRVERQRSRRSSSSSYQSACVANEVCGRSSADEVDRLVVGQAPCAGRRAPARSPRRSRTTAARRAPSRRSSSRSM